MAVSTAALTPVAARLQQEAGERRAPPTPFEKRVVMSTISPVVVCAWCARHGRAKGAAREAHSGRWHLVSHEFVRWHTAAGMVSHGLCTWCRVQMTKAA